MGNIINGVNETIDAWGLFESRIERYPILEADEQMSLWAIYNATRGTVEGQEAFAELAGANWRLAKKVVGDTLKVRATQASKSVWAELASEANVALCEAIESYDPEKGGSLPGYVATCVERRLSNAMNGELPAAWSKVRRIAGGVEQNLTARLGRSPDEAELVEGVQAYCINWAKERLIEAGEPADEEKAKAKLVRQGTWAATLRLGEIRNKGRTLSLDQEDENGASLLDTLAGAEPDEAIDVIAWFLGSLVPDDKQLIVRRYGLDGASEGRFEDLAEERGMEWPVVRSHINAIMGRMYAPHAHYASLAPGVEAQFIAEAKTSSASSRLKTRRI